MARDPVCGMEIEEQAAAATRKVDGEAFFFCSECCVQQFDADPARYTKQVTGAKETDAIVGSASGTGHLTRTRWRRVEERRW